tara:strand:+ start:986 stop:1402 length:417 start_codon:yes stop_codon:yes gene_type:complete
MNFDDYIESVRNKGFSWGDHDCITFANKACALQIGHGFADEFLGKYETAKGAMLTYRRWLKATHYADLVAGVDDRLNRLNTNMPPIGSIVAEPFKNKNGVLPIQFGVSLGRLCGFVGKRGLVFAKSSSRMMFWSVQSG